MTDYWIACLMCELAGEHTGVWTDGDSAEEAASLCMMPGKHVTVTIGLDPDDLRRCLLGHTATDGEVYLASRALDGIEFHNNNDVTAFVEYLRHRTDLPFGPDSVAVFESSYKGRFADRADYAKQYAEMVGEWTQVSAPWPTGHIDWTRAAEALFRESDRWDLDAVSGGIYVFGDEK
ncbi:hypothetical protein [Paractinoplanes rishiriensis]|uniref:Antirestriction protein n=1 Tax=Paractinoplanes rishiriensis TaxID=1050105 RepID=A0A919MXS3_9ACTN|nr:hypothetical protein [Actinoplanes rishiriensis]GIE98949.1 hypothetical protein Ari01nite_64140 [Actinoplanes rishiriensis]